MNKKKTISELVHFEIGDKGKELIKALENCKFHEHAPYHHPFLDRNSLNRTHSEAFMVPHLTDIFMRGVKDFKKAEEKDRARFDITFNDGQQVHIFVLKQNYEGGASYTANAIDARPLHFHILTEVGEGVEWAAMRNDQNNFSRDKESMRIKPPKLYFNQIILQEFNKRWDEKDPLPDFFVAKPIEQRN
jgi:hypothetical protein